MGISLFSDRGLRLVDGYTGPMEPPADPDEARDEAIYNTINAIWADGDWLEAACAYDRVELSLRFCRLLAPLRSWIEKEPETMDGDYRGALRELIRCIDKEVYKAAVRHVDDDGFTGDAA